MNENVYILISLYARAIIYIIIGISVCSLKNIEILEGEATGVFIE